ncbi:hypothetical protein VPH35_125967 [Triticum aestivum]
MPDKKGATMLEDLPGEIMDMILTRLPSKDVGRCRVVNTSWRSATSTPKFMLEHHCRQPLVPIVDARGRAVSHVVFGDVGGGTSSQELWPLVREGNLRQFNFVIGFYRHHPTGECRVLWFSQSHDSSKSSVYVLTVGSDKPRRIIVKIPTVSLPSVENSIMNEVHFSSGFSPPVHHRGSLHWWLSGSSDIMGGSADIIVFDTKAESFRWMRSPGQHCPNSMLFDMKGTLAFWAGSTPASFSTMDVWVMQDYEAQIWAFKYRIQLSTVEASRQLYLTSYKKKKRTPIHSMVQSFNDMAVLNERELLVRFNGKHVLHCDVDGKFLGLVKIGKNQHCMRLAHYRLQESILPIPSHEMHQG